MAEGSYSEHAMSNGGQKWGERFAFNKIWIVIFNPYLSKKIEVLINGEVVWRVNAIEYLAKYGYKGLNIAILMVGNKYDEIAMILLGRYISLVQAIWQLFEHTTH